MYLSLHESKQNYVKLTLPAKLYQTAQLIIHNYKLNCVNEGAVSIFSLDLLITIKSYKLQL